MKQNLCFPALLCLFRSKLPLNPFCQAQGAPKGDFGPAMIEAGPPSGGWG